MQTTSLYDIINMLYVTKPPLAQLDRASDSDSEGYRFEPRRAGQKYFKQPTLAFARVGCFLCNKDANNIYLQILKIIKGLFFKNH